jgi:phosphate/sulfate permease
MSDAAPEPASPAARARPPSNLINSVAFALFSSIVALVFLTGFGAAPSVSATYTAAAAGANVATQPGDAALPAPSGVAAILRVPEDASTTKR